MNAAFRNVGPAVVPGTVFIERTRDLLRLLSLEAVTVDPDHGWFAVGIATSMAVSPATGNRKHFLSADMASWASALARCRIPDSRPVTRGRK